MPVTVLRGHSNAIVPISLGSSAVAATGGTAAVTLTAAVAVGDVIMGAVAWNNGAGALTWTGADNHAGTTNVYSSGNAQGSALAGVSEIRCVCTTALIVGDIVTITFTTGGTGRLMALFKIPKESGIITPLVSAGVNGASGNTTTPTPGSVTPSTFGPCFQFAAYEAEGNRTGTPPAGYTELFDINDAVGAALQVNYITTLTVDKSARNPAETISNAAQWGAIQNFYTVAVAKRNPQVNSGWIRKTRPRLRGQVMFLRNGQASSGTLFPVAVGTAAAPSSPTLKLQAGKLLTLGEGSTPTLKLQVGKLLSLSRATTPTLALQAQKRFTLSAGSTPTLVAVRVALITLSTSAGSLASMIRQTRKPLTISEGSTPTMLRKTSKTLTLGEGSTPTMAVLKVSLITLSTSAGSLATMTRRAGKLLVASGASTTSLSVRVGKLLAASSSTTPTLQRVIAKTLGASAASAPTLAVSALKKITLVALAPSSASGVFAKVAAFPQAFVRFFSDGGEPAQGSAGGEPSLSSTGGEPSQSSTGGEPNQSSSGGLPTL